MVSSFPSAPSWAHVHYLSLYKKNVSLSRKDMLIHSYILKKSDEWAEKENEIH